MPKAKSDAAARPDAANPESRAREVRRAKSALNDLGEVVGEQAAQAVRRRPGRPAKADAKVNQTLRLDPDVLAAYRSLGPGWQTKMNAVLREHMPGRGK